MQFCIIKSDYEVDYEVVEIDITKFLKVKIKQMHSSIVIMVV